MKESNIAREILIAASKAGHRLFLNPRGQGWIGHLVSIVEGTVTLRGARKVTFGVGPDGASDLIGWTLDGKFAALEIKTENGAIRDGQEEFCAAVREAGGRAGIVRSVDEALAVLNGQDKTRTGP